MAEQAVEKDDAPVEWDYDKSRFGGVQPGRYKDGDVNHVLQPVMGWLSRDLASGNTIVGAEAIQNLIDRMESACQSETDWLAGRRVTHPAQTGADQ